MKPLIKLHTAFLCCLTFAIAGSSLARADAVAVYVVDNSGGPHIDEYTAAGALVRTLSGGPVGIFYKGLAFGADGNLYATDTFGCITTCSNELEKFNPTTGGYMGAVGSFTGGALSSTGLTLGPGNDLYVTTNQDGLYKIDPGANTTTSITTAVCCDIGVAFLPGGTPLSASSGNLVKNDLTGVAFNSGFFISASAIAFGPDGRLYVLENNQVDTVPSTGGAFTRLTAPNALIGGVFETFDSQGNLWATDVNYGVREFNSSTGQEITSFTSLTASGFQGIAVGPFTPVPEPSSLLLLGTGLLGLGGAVKRRFFS